METPSLLMEQVPISVLAPDPRNARTHSKKQIRQIAASIKEFGFVNPVLIDEANLVIAGHGRLAAAQQVGIDHVPVIRICHLTEQQKRALAIADNKIASNAGWDIDLLAEEIQYLSEIDVDFDVEITGFETAELDILIEGLDPAGDDEENDHIPDAETAGPPVSIAGDLWRLGHHRLLCSNAMEAGSFDRLMAGETAQMVITDPPFNVPIDGHVSGLGRTRHREFMMGSGEMSKPEFIKFLVTVFGHLVIYSADGSIHFIFMDWRHLPEILTAGEAVYTEFKQLCVWAKSNAGMGSFYRSQHELVLAFKSGKAAHINNFQLGQHGRHRSNVWRYPGINTFRKGRLEELEMHPTIKPTALIADAIKDCSKRGGVVLDCFAGSGTTLIAAETTGRRAYAMELDPVYVDTAIRRWQAFTGEDAVHGVTGQTFAVLADLRTAEAEDGSANSSDQSRTRRPDDV